MLVEGSLLAALIFLKKNQESLENSFFRSMSVRDCRVKNKHHFSRLPNSLAIKIYGLRRNDEMGACRNALQFAPNERVF